MLRARHATSFPASLRLIPTRLCLPAVCAPAASQLRLVSSGQLCVPQLEDSPLLDSSRSVTSIQLCVPQLVACLESSRLNSTAVRAPAGKSTRLDSSRPVPSHLESFCLLPSRCILYFYVLMYTSWTQADSPLAQTYPQKIDPSTTYSTAPAFSSDAQYYCYSYKTEQPQWTTTMINELA